MENSTLVAQRSQLNFMSFPDFSGSVATLPMFSASLHSKDVIRKITRELEAYYNRKLKSQCNDNFMENRCTRIGI